MNDRPTPDFTIAQLRAVLELPETVEDSNALTIGEMAEAFGRDRGTIRRRVVAALAAGTLEEVVVERPDSTGRMQTRTAYRPISSVHQTG